MMFGQQPYVYQQPIYNQPIGQPISQPMQEPMMRPQYQPAPQIPAYQPQPQQPQNQSIIWIPNEQAANDFIVAPNNAVTLWDMNAPVVYVKKADASGKPLVAPGGAPIAFNKPNYVDIGLGFELTGTGMDASADPRTAVVNNFSGVEAFGFGVDADGNPKNVYSLLGKVAADLRVGNSSTLSTDLDAVKAMHSALLTQVTDMGNRSDFIEQTSARLENDILNLQEVQNRVEAVPLEQEMMYNKDFEMSWMVTLQLGSKILPPSIFNFLQ